MPPGRLVQTPPSCLHMVWSYDLLLTGATAIYVAGSDSTSIVMSVRTQIRQSPWARSLEDGTPHSRRLTRTVFRVAHLNCVYPHVRQCIPALPDWAIAKVADERLTSLSLFPPTTSPYAAPIVTRLRVLHKETPKSKTIAIL